MKKYVYKNKRTNEVIESDQLLHDEDLKLLVEFKKKPIIKYYKK
jgi:hypothetical protein